MLLQKKCQNKDGDNDDGANDDDNENKHGNASKDLEIKDGTD